MSVRPGGPLSFGPGWLSLAASAGTLVCCALPALLVLLGFGAATASLLGSAPWLVTISRHKDWVFAGSGALLAFNGWYVYSLRPRLAARGAACDPADAAACRRTAAWSRAVLLASGVLFGVGAFTAYALGPILDWWYP